MYLSKNDLIRKAGISPTEANKIWSSFYFSGWNNFLPIGVLVSIVFVVFLFNLQAWFVFTGILLIHCFIALPITSKNIRKHLANAGKDE